MHTQDISSLNQISQPEVNARFAEIEARNPDLTELTDRAFAEASMHPDNVLQEQLRDHYEDRFASGWLNKLNTRPAQQADSVQESEPAVGIESYESQTIQAIERLSTAELHDLIQNTTSYVAAMHHRDDFTLVA